MQLREYDIMYNQETTYWWHLGMTAIMKQMLTPTLTPASKLLDVGCGTGGRLMALASSCETWGIDYHSRAVELCRKRGLKNIQQADATELPFAAEAFSHIIYCEVLQNLEDEPRAMSEAYRVLKPGGYLYISEQAYPVLRSQHDVSQGAVRRYTKKYLNRLLTDAGFDIERMTSANMVLFPPLAAWRLINKAVKPPQKIVPGESQSDLKQLPGLVNSTFLSILETEKNLLKKVNLPFGLTIITLAKKPG